MKSGCVDASMAILPSSKSQGVKPASTRTIPATIQLSLTRQTSSASRRTAARTSTVESPRATDWLGPVSSNTPASRYG